jgi:hypothetical protein
MCRPATNLKYGAIMTIYKEAFPWLSKELRMFPPNMWAYMVYQRLLDRKINWHRDNYFGDALKRMLNNDPPRSRRQQRSQRDGTCVIVYSMGNCPMNMCFKVLDPRLGPKQMTSSYKICPTFTFQCGPGWISILDVMDDVFMQHSLTFNGIETMDPDMDVRVGLVMITGSNWQEYYTDTSTIRLPDHAARFISQGDIILNIKSKMKDSFMAANPELVGNSDEPVSVQYLCTIRTVVF